MSLENKFDKIVRDKVEEINFPFDESNWQKASKLIDADRAVSAGNGGKLFLLFGLLTLLLGTGGYLGYRYFNSAGDNKVAQNNAVVNAVANASDNANTNTDLQQTGNVSSSEINNSSSSNNISTTTSQATEANNSTANPGENSVTANITSDKGINSTGSSAAGASNSNNVNNLSNASGKPVKSANTSGSNYKGNASSQKSSNSNGTDVSGKENGNSVAGQKSTGSEGSDSELTNTSNSENYRTSNLSEMLMNMPGKELKLPVSIDSAMRKTPYDFIRAYDNDYFKRHSKRKSNYLNVEVGTTYLMGWFTLNGTDGRGFNGFAGTNYGFYMGRQSSISIGAQIYNISNIKQPFYTASKLNYGFGSTGTYTSVTTNNLVYFAVPLKYNFHINKLNQVGVGVNAGFLFTGNNTVETYRVQDNVRESISKKTQKGNFEGVNTENVVVSAFFSHAFNRRFKLNGELLYGISDLYRDTPVSTTKERTIGAKLSLQYNIFEK